MKFLCGHCKAKYHIPDEKIAGRTLRMDCRRCGKEIILKGEPGRNSRRPSASPRRSKAPSRPSALSSDFRDHVRTVPPSMPPSDQWHVAINDVPVGPIRTSEVQRKMSTGAVGAESLCWREGFDDWRPVREVPELNALLRQVPPPPVQTPLGRGIHRSGSRSRPRIVKPSSHPGSSLSAAPPAAPPPPSNVVPIGGRGGASAAASAALEELPGAPTSISEAPIAQSAAELEALPAPSFQQDTAYPHEATASDFPVHSKRDRRKGIPVIGWIAIAVAVPFGTTLALLIANRVLFPPQTVAVQQLSPTQETNAPDPNIVAPEIPTVREEVNQETNVPPAEESAAQEAEETSTKTASNRPSRGQGRSAPAEKQLSEEDRRRLERMRESGGGGPSLSRNDFGQFDNGQKSRSDGLSASELNAVVGRNRPRLRSCYERAVRGMGAPPEVRVNVSLTVGRTGRVTQAGVTASNNVSGLTSCVEGAVRRWVFPASGASTPVQFPIVFGSG